MSFYVLHDNRRWLVRTEVGDGLARVVFEEEQPQQVAPQPLEVSEAEHG